MFLTMTSDSKDYDGLYLSNYAKLNLVDQLPRVPGVGAVNVMGAGDYSMRISVSYTHLHAYPVLDLHGSHINVCAYGKSNGKRVSAR